MAAEPLSEVIAGGDRKASLAAIRDRIAVELTTAEGRDVAPLAKELRAVIAELDGLPGAREGSPSDDLASRRASRRAAARGAATAGQ